MAAIAAFGGSGGLDSIGTEVQILTSPLVLRPIFLAVKEQKPAASAQSMNFEDWANSAITVEKEVGTSVLNVEFRDTDKNLVLPITQMISEAYQSYSNRGRARELSNAISYLKDQIASIKPLAEESSRVAFDYGFDNGLTLLDGLPIAGNVRSIYLTERFLPKGQVIGMRGSLRSPHKCPTN